MFENRFPNSTEKLVHVLVGVSDHEKVYFHLRKSKKGNIYPPKNRKEEMLVTLKLPKTPPHISVPRWRPSLKMLPVSDVGEFNVAVDNLNSRKKKN